MKRRWIVIVQQGCGHELHNMISDARLIGPFTQATAERLAAKMNAKFSLTTDSEPQEAHAEPLEYCSPREAYKSVAQ